MINSIQSLSLSHTCTKNIRASIDDDDTTLNCIEDVGYVEDPTEDDVDAIYTS